MKKHRHYYGKKYPSSVRCKCGHYKRGYIVKTDEESIKPLRDLLGGFFSPPKK